MHAGKCEEIESTRLPLYFDEMSLQPALSYNKFEGAIHGFQCTSGSSVQRIADHVMVFMVVGICKKWKQPVAYFF
jgi:hypothetical protein